MQSKLNGSGATAIHEAGHTIVSWAVGLDVDSIEVDGDDGIVRHPDDLLRRYQKSGRQSEWQRLTAAVALGGMIAEDIYTRAATTPLVLAMRPEPRRFFAWVKNSNPLKPFNDTARVARYCRSGGKRHTEARAFQLYRQVHAMLVEPHRWRMVENLAVEIEHRHGRMTRQALEAFRNQDPAIDQFGPLA